jgi:hypothetical protein
MSHVAAKLQKGVVNVLIVTKKKIVDDVKTAKI